MKYLDKFVYQVEKIGFDERPNYARFIDVLEKCQELYTE